MKLRFECGLDNDQDCAKDKEQACMAGGQACEHLVIFPVTTKKKTKAQKLIKVGLQ